MAQAPSSTFEATSSSTVGAPAAGDLTAPIEAEQARLPEQKLMQGLDESENTIINQESIATAPSQSVKKMVKRMVLVKPKPQRVQTKAVPKISRPEPVIQQPPAAAAAAAPVSQDVEKRSHLFRDSSESTIDLDALPRMELRNRGIRWSHRNWFLGVAIGAFQNPFMIALVAIATALYGSMFFMGFTLLQFTITYPLLSMGFGLFQYASRSPIVLFKRFIPGMQGVGILFMTVAILEIIASNMGMAKDLVIIISSNSWRLCPPSKKVSLCYSNIDRASCERFNYGNRENRTAEGGNEKYEDIRPPPSPTGAFYGKGQCFKDVKHYLDHLSDCIKFWSDTYGTAEAKSLNQTEIKKEESTGADDRLKTESDQSASLSTKCSFGIVYQPTSMDKWAESFDEKNEAVSPVKLCRRSSVTRSLCTDFWNQLTLHTNLNTFPMNQTKSNDVGKGGSKNPSDRTNFDRAHHLVLDLRIDKRHPIEKASVLKRAQSLHRFMTHYHNLTRKRQHQLAAVSSHRISSTWRGFSGHALAVNHAGIARFLPKCYAKWMNKQVDANDCFRRYIVMDERRAIHGHYDRAFGNSDVSERSGFGSLSGTAKFQILYIGILMGAAYVILINGTLVLEKICTGLNVTSFVIAALCLCWVMVSRRDFVSGLLQLIRIDHLALMDVKFWILLAVTALPVGSYVSSSWLTVYSPSNSDFLQYGLLLVTLNWFMTLIVTVAVSSLPGWRVYLNEIERLRHLSAFRIETIKSLSILQLVDQYPQKGVSNVDGEADSKQPPSSLENRALAIALSVLFILIGFTSFLSLAILLLSTLMDILPRLLPTRRRRNIALLFILGICIGITLPSLFTTIRLFFENIVYPATLTIIGPLLICFVHLTAIWIYGMHEWTLDIAYIIRDRQRKPPGKTDMDTSELLEMSDSELEGLYAHSTRSISGKEQALHNTGDNDLNSGKSMTSANSSRRRRRRWQLLFPEDYTIFSQNYLRFKTSFGFKVWSVRTSKRFFQVVWTGLIPLVAISIPTAYIVDHFVGPAELRWSVWMTEDNVFICRLLFGFATVVIALVIGFIIALVKKKTYQPAKNLDGGGGYRHQPVSLTLFHVSHLWRKGWRRLFEDGPGTGDEGEGAGASEMDGRSGGSSRKKGDGLMGGEPEHPEIEVWKHMDEETKEWTEELKRLRTSAIQPTQDDPMSASWVEDEAPEDVLGPDDLPVTVSTTEEGRRMKKYLREKQKKKQQQKGKKKKKQQLGEEDEEEEGEKGEEPEEDSKDEEDMEQKKPPPKKKSPKKKPPPKKTKMKTDEKEEESGTLDGGSGTTTTEQGPAGGRKGKKKGKKGKKTTAADDGGDEGGDEDGEDAVEKKKKKKKKKPKTKPKQTADESGDEADGDEPAATRETVHGKKKKKSKQTGTDDIGDEDGGYEEEKGVQGKKKKGGKKGRNKQDASADQTQEDTREGKKKPKKQQQQSEQQAKGVKKSKKKKGHEEDQQQQPYIIDMDIDETKLKKKKKKKKAKEAAAAETAQEPQQSLRSMLVKSDFESAMKKLKNKFSDQILPEDVAGAPGNPPPGAKQKKEKDENSLPTISL